MSFHCIEDGVFRLWCCGFTSTYYIYIYIDRNLSRLLASTNCSDPLAGSFFSRTLTYPKPQTIMGPFWEPFPEPSYYSEPLLQPPALPRPLPVRLPLRYRCCCCCCYCFGYCYCSGYGCRFGCYCYCGDSREASPPNHGGCVHLWCLVCCSAVVIKVPGID